MRSNTVINPAELQKQQDKRTNYTSANFIVRVATILVPETNGYYRALPGKKVLIKFDVELDGVKRNELDQLNLVVPLDKFIDGKKVDQMFLDVGIVRGDFSISGNFTLPGEWRLDFDNINESLKLINSDWKLNGTNITFFV